MLAPAARCYAPPLVADALGSRQRGGSTCSSRKARLLLWSQLNTALRSAIDGRPPLHRTVLRHPSASHFRHGGHSGVNPSDLVARIFPSHPPKNERMLLLTDRR
jgi:hypothetical protein